jgi:hypothetical protein
MNRTSIIKELDRECPGKILMNKSEVRRASGIGIERTRALLKGVDCIVSARRKYYLKTDVADALMGAKTPGSRL